MYQQITYIETFCTKGVLLSFCISATTPLISIPALTINYDSQNLTWHSKTKQPYIAIAEHLQKRLVFLMYLSKKHTSIKHCTNEAQVL